jgi:serine/threonine protein phosphatase PrpC
MGVSAIIAKLWREVFGQGSLKPECAPTEASPAWNQECVHTAIGEGALQGEMDDVCRQRTLPSAAFTPRSPVSVEPTRDLKPGRPGDRRMDKSRVFEVERSQEHFSGLLVGWLSDPGIKRRNGPNEDSLFAAKGLRPQHAQSQAVGLFIVADGMGGHVYGQEASRMAIQIMIDVVLPKLFVNNELNDVSFRKLLVDGVQAANRVIYQRNQAQSTEMGTTITAVLIIDSAAFVVNVGDSRTYLYREGEGLRKVTHDHSLVTYLVESGILKPEDIYIHPQRNQIYRSLGTKPVITVDAFTEQVQPHDTLLLCSDGLWEMVRDPHIQQVLQHTASPSQKSHMLFEAAMGNGGSDNISMIFVSITGETRPREETGLQMLTLPEQVELPAILQSQPKRSTSANRVAQPGSEHN